ncbi:hypothetical protein SLEP1_g3165 [Rubroshorea leprosula]|uniref:Uncharacterized protein n=1 Tax=Rubroshorea leprosula TaxID=152421 RepID=A0AAV5HVB7_9ROSI|nr:hypothetical protein SLEP1_g3165 [Rubroshorea leprosula]
MNKGNHFILERLAQIEKKLDEHIQKYRMTAPSTHLATMTNPSTVGTSSGQPPAEPSSMLKA